jgi:uncharacterized membrane protein
MSEQRKLLLILAITAVLGIGSFSVTTYILGTVLQDTAFIIDEYHAQLFLNGTLIEDYLYTVREARQFSMLFRQWKAPVSFAPLDIPYIEVLRINVPEGATAYVKDHQGAVWVDPDREVPRLYVSRDAQRNELGMYLPEIPAGQYRVRYVLRLHPPIQYDETHAHINLKLADEHVPYRQIVVAIEAHEWIDTIYPHPPELQRVPGNPLELSGSSARNELLEVEFLLDVAVLSVLDGFPTRVENVQSTTAQANAFYSTFVSLAELQRILVTILVLTMPLILYLIYWRFGKETETTVPQYLSYVPNPQRKPWLVNRIFKNDSMKSDQHGFFATLLDLHQQGYITLTPQDKGFTIQLIKLTSDDPYEQRVLTVLQRQCQFALPNDTVTSADLLQMRSQRVEYSTIQRVDREASSQFITTGRRPLTMLVLGAIVVLITLFIVPEFAKLGWQSADTRIMSGLFVVQSLIAWITPPQLFGRWKGSFYEEKLQWDAFRRVLSDLALIKQYAPQDLTMWGNWLIYGTALGVGDTVVKVLDEFDIQLVGAMIFPLLLRYFAPAFGFRVSGPGGGTSGGGGGFGGGSGFGGGGAGAR